MNLSNYNPRMLDTHNPNLSMKRSVLVQTYLNPNIPSHHNQNRSSVSKRASFNLNHSSSNLINGNGHTQNQYAPPSQYPKTPKSNMQYGIENFNLPAQYFHRSNYVNQNQNYQPAMSMQIPTSHTHLTRTQSQNTNKSEISISTSRVQSTNNKIQAFSLQDKKTRQLQELIKQLNNKIQRTVLQVQKHEQALKKYQTFHQSHPYQYQYHPSPPVTVAQPQLTNQSVLKLIQQQIADNNKIYEIQSIDRYNLLKGQIQDIKEQVKGYTNMHSINANNGQEIEDKLAKVSQNLSKQLSTFSKGISHSITHLLEQQQKFKKQQEKNYGQFSQINQLYHGLQQKLKSISSALSQPYNPVQISSMPYSTSQKKFTSDPILLKSLTKFSICLNPSSPSSYPSPSGSSQSTNWKSLEQTETVYKIDSEGYLLDSQSKYIINKKYQQIKLNEEQIQMLRDRGLIR